MIINHKNDKKIDIQFELNAGNSQIFGDNLHLRNVVNNIVDNAIKYSPEASTISITLYQQNQLVVVEIRDNGPGIPDEDVSHIFDRFYRVQKDRARRTGGSGLGLSIGMLIARSHRGDIEVESKTGEGTVFRVTLPVRLAGDQN